MDLGATVCTRSNPSCSVCPVEEDCLARIHSETALLPNRGASKRKREKEVFWLVPIDKNNNVYLEKRPEKGIWGGLW